MARTCRVARAVLRRGPHSLGQGLSACLPACPPARPPALFACLPACLIRTRLGQAAVDNEVVELVWRRICPELIDGTMAMDAPSSLQLIAPRPLLIANGEVDMRCPKEGVELALSAASRAWAAAAPEMQPTLYFEPRGGHAVSDEMWRRVDQFFERHLKPGKGSNPSQPKARADL